jgi:choice-of-anchor A domain-containing protein
MPVVRRFLPILPLLSAAWGGAAQASVLSLTAPVGGANVYAIHDFTSTSSDVQGAIVAGGNVTLSNYSVNALNKDAFGSKDVALVAGGNLKLSSGSINNGVVYVGGTTSLSSAAPLKAAGGNPVDFNAAESYYKTLATALDQLDPTGSVSKLWSGVKLTGSGKGGVDVFDVSSEMLRTSSSWTLEQLVPGQTLIFNIGGTSGTFNGGGISFEPLAGYNVLFNFYEATSVNVKGVIGSVLAPYATVSENWGAVNGNVIVDTWNSTVQINAGHDFAAVEVPGLNLGGKPGNGQSGAPIEPPADSTAQVPEPGSMALLVAGALAALLTAARRGRALRGARAPAWPPRG